MKILFDHQAFAIQEYGGISRYFLELMDQFKVNKTLGVSFDVALQFSNNQFLKSYSFLKYRKFLPKTRFKGKGPLLNNINKVYSCSLLKQRDFDIFHPTYYDPYFLKYLNGKPFVLTVHDLIHEMFPQYFSRFNKIKKFKKHVIAKAERIIAVSNNTKKDLLKFYNIDPDSIHVVYHGNPYENAYSDKRISSNDQYFLFVGDRQNYKNFHFLISSLAPILQVHSQVKIMCAGGGKFTSVEKKDLKILDIQNQVYQLETTDEGLKKLYSGALAFIFPSLYEGFGFPILEAFSCGCPTILSNTSSLPEIGGDAAIYFDPVEPDSLRSAILRVYEDENLRKQMIDSGLNRVKKFTWEQTAAQTKTVYDSTLGDN
jgi:glycosyltransferase involved in cell wall biosynthesis